MSIIPGESPYVSWTLTNPWGINFDPTNNTWASGRVYAFLALDVLEILLGTEQGGVWMLNPFTFVGPLARPIGDFDDPNITCLALGPDGAHHVYAGASQFGTVWEANPSAQEPLEAWRSIGDSATLGPVYGIVVLKDIRRVVVTAKLGIFWADIPRPGGVYLWKKAKGATDGGYFGVTVGQGDRVVVGALNFTSSAQAIYYGNFVESDLVMKPATIAPALSAAGGYISVSSCTANPAAMYALCQQPNGQPLAVLRAGNTGNWTNGESWVPAGKTIVGAPPNKDITNVLGQQNFKVISTSPVDAKTVAFADIRSLISHDYGASWNFLPTSGSWDNQGKFIVPLSTAVHSDGHVVYFDSTDPTGNRIYLGSDGGVALSGDGGKTFSTNTNQKLPNLLFQSEPERNLFGEFTVDETGWLLAGGLEDNGVVYCVTEPSPSPWTELETGDGMQALFISGERLLWKSNDGGGIHHARWNGHDVADLNPAILPVSKPKPGSAFPRGFPSSDIRVFQARVTAGPMVAVSVFTPDVTHPFASPSDVYGVFADKNGQPTGWQYLGSVPTGGGAWSIATCPGAPIFIGTTDSRILQLSWSGGSIVTMNMTPFIRANSTIYQLVVNSTFPGLDGYALAAASGVGVGSQVLRLANGSVLANQGAWEYVSGLNDELYYDLAVDWTVSPEVVYLASDSNVYVSFDQGTTWQSASQGLPRRPHCSRLRFVGNPSKLLYLTTYGRSVWTGRITGQVGGSGGAGGGGGEGSGGQGGHGGGGTRLPQ